MSVRQRKPESTLSSSANGALPAASKKSSSPRLLHWNDLPHWQRDNHHIHTGYRPASASFSRSFSSLLYLHNESVNIYTHLLPALFSLPISYLLYRTLRPRYSAATSSDVVAFACFFLGAALCLGMSAMYHTTSNHSSGVARFGNKLDYVGIVLLITGSFVPSVYYGFYRERGLQMVYWTMVRTPESMDDWEY